MKRIFRMNKMIARLKKEGREDQITPEIMETMKKYDGQVANDYNWKSQVYGENLSWISPIKEGEEGIYVNTDDCEVC